MQRIRDELARIRRDLEMANAGLEVREVQIESIVAECTPYLIVDLETAVIAKAGPMLESMFGYIQGELVGRSVHELVPLGLRDGHHEHFDSFAANPHPRQMGKVGMTLRGVRRDGRELPVEIGLYPRAWEGRRYVVAIVLPVGRE
jgi:PAS domain S-box-containing protein